MSKKNNNKNGTFGYLLQSAGVESANFKVEPIIKTKISPNKPDKNSDSVDSWEKIKQESIKIKSSDKNTCNINSKKCKPDIGLKKDSSKINKNRLSKNKTKSNKNTHQNNVSQPPLDLSCYGSNDKKVKAINASSSLDSKPTIQVKISGAVYPNTDDFIIQNRNSRLKPSDSGINGNLSYSKNDEGVLIIGLDFGTSNSKIIIHDPQRTVFYAIPFFDIGVNDRYIYPSRVFLEKDSFNLDETGKCLSDLKLPLLNQSANDEDIYHAVAYLALLIRHARGWLFSNYSEVYRNVDIIWSLNLGIATATYEDSYLYKRFRHIALAAINLAGDSSEEITYDLVKNYLISTLRALTNFKYAGELKTHPDTVNVFPEIGAQVLGFIKSESWDDKNRPFIIMIDVGAGTVDVSFFSVQRKSGQANFSFFSNDVFFNGVVSLHKRRANWLKDILTEADIITPSINHFLDDIVSPSLNLKRIPESCINYLVNFDVKQTRTIDHDFFDEYKDRVKRLLVYTRRKRVPLNNDNWIKLPVFLCGGGSRMHFYKDIIEKLNAFEPSWLHLIPLSLGMPSNLRADGLSTTEYDRLSVAYGLSYEKLGTIISSAEIEDFSTQYLPRRELPINQYDDG
ncbi:hypothetical protein [Methylomonas koyamae]|uniref:hypothetical protein n=1 Tax=Methylomonas koyamae TaxID=702114 RepID=UPI002873D70B|nr:hypothetical protein [Methylomonas koyamae]WNB75105.1 hypothetical protein RI210_17735 [Methylomonas koyamae]